LFLARCLGFTTIWEKHQELWQREEGGFYSDLGAFAPFIVDACSRQFTDLIVAAIGIIEKLHVDGGQVVPTSAIGFLEGLSNFAS